MWKNNEWREEREKKHTAQTIRMSYVQRQEVESLAPLDTGGIELNRVGRDDDDEELALAPKREPSSNFKGHFANMIPAG